jgi:hypothetical protein
MMLLAAAVSNEVLIAVERCQQCRVLVLKIPAEVVSAGGAAGCCIAQVSQDGSVWCCWGLTLFEWC